MRKQACCFIGTYEIHRFVRCRTHASLTAQSFDDYHRETIG